MRRLKASVAALAVLAALPTIGVIVASNAGAAIFHGAAVPEGAPALRVTTVMDELTNAWDVAFLADGTMFVTERPGAVHVRFVDGTERELTADLSDLWVSVESGLQGIEVDPDFATNRRIYTCQGTTDVVDDIVDGTSTQVVVWTVDEAFTTLTRVNDPLVGWDGNNERGGFHTGCALRIDRDGRLWIGAGDSGIGTNPQNRFVLSGKTLRIDRFTGAGLPGNPFFGNPSAGDARIFTYGHRNVQGLAIHPVTGGPWSVEHGTFRDDEVNVLVPGGNYGWDPVPGYNEQVPMTDRYKFRKAQRASWASGNPTIAPSGATFLTGTQWGAWQGALAVATLKGASLRIMGFNRLGQLTGMAIPPELNGTFGRLRAAETGPCGVLYMTTDVGNGQSRVLAVEPEVNNRGPAVVNTGPTSTEIGRCGPSGSVELRTVDGPGVSAWRSIGGRAASEPDLASRGPGQVDVLVIGPDGSMWHQSVSDGAPGVWRSMGGQFSSAPTAVAVGPDRLDAFGRGLDGQVWTARMVGSTWSSWQPLGGLLRFGPEVSIRNATTFDVFGVGTDGAMWHLYYDGTRAVHWEPLGGLFTSSPASISSDGTKVDVFGRGTDRALWRAAWTGTAWTGWSSLGGSLAAAPAATVEGSDWSAYIENVDGSFSRRSALGFTALPA